jgi:hypothetical protein
MTAILERLAAAQIELAPVADAGRHFIFTRDGFAALVERTPEGGFGSIGSSGKLTGQGFAALVWRGESGYFVARGTEIPATAEDVAALRRFAADLEAALRK